MTYAIVLNGNNLNRGHWSLLNRCTRNEMLLYQNSPLQYIGHNNYKSTHIDVSRERYDSCYIIEGAI